MNMKWEVVSPLGKAAVETIPLAPRLDTLESKTVCEVWNAGFAGEVTFPIIRRMLRERYPGIKMIPYTEFPLTPVISMKQVRKEQTLEAVRKALVEKGCNAVITGNGG